MCTTMHNTKSQSAAWKTIGQAPQAAWKSPHKPLLRYKTLYPEANWTILIENTLNVKGSLKDITLTTNLVGNGVGLHANTQVHPFANNLAQLIGRIKVEGQGIVHVPLCPLCRAPFGFHIERTTQFGDNIALDGKLDLRNKTPEAADKNGIPMKNLVGAFNVNDTGSVDIQNLSAELMQNGKLSLTGSVYAQKQTSISSLNWTRQLAADEHEIGRHTQWHDSRTRCVWQTASRLATEHRSCRHLSSLKIVSDTVQKQQTLLIENGIVKPKNGGELQFSGSFRSCFKTKNYKPKSKARRSIQRSCIPICPKAMWTAASKRLYDKTSVPHRNGVFAVHIVGCAFVGRQQVSYENQHLSRADTAIKLGNNRINTQGAFGKAGDKLAVDIDAPNLDLFGFGLHGLLTAKGTLTNTANSFTAIDAKLDGQARGFSVGSALKKCKMPLSGCMVRPTLREPWTSRSR